jgi:hypothetical protein
VETVGVAVCAVHLSEKVVENSEATERVECAGVSERVLERDVTPGCGGKVVPRIERFIIVVVF